MERLEFQTSSFSSGPIVKFHYKGCSDKTLRSFPTGFAGLSLEILLQLLIWRGVGRNA